MDSYVRRDGSYYEGERERADDQLVPQRNDPDTVFDGWQWQVVPAKQRAKQTEQINAERDAQIFGGIEFEGNVYDTDLRSVTNLATTVTALNAGMALPAGFVWRTQDNINVPATAEQLKALLSLMVMTGFAIYAAAWAEKDSL